MTERQFGWGRVALVACLFLPAFAAVLRIWHVRPPLPLLDGADINGVNVAGDLKPVLGLLAFEFVAAVAALQPWTPTPSRFYIGLSGLAFGLWGMLWFFTGLHAPPVQLPHDLLMLAVGLVLCFCTLVFPGRQSEPDATTPAA